MNYSLKLLCYAPLGLILLSASCGKKSSSDAGSSSASTYTMNAVNSSHLAQSFAATTPASFKSTTSLQLTGACTTTYGAGTPGETACNTMADIQSRFFSGTGPTDIASRLASMDTTLNSAVESAFSAYTPCLDSSRTTSGTYTIQQTGGSSSVSFPAFALTTVPLKTTFKAGISLDTTDSLKLSCYDGSNTGDSATTGVGNAYGFDSSTGTWYLYDLSSNYIGTFGSTDQNDNVEMWFSIGDTSYATDQGQAAGESSSSYGGSTGIVQIISKPSLGLVGLAQVGVGVGPGCGAQLLMNSSTLYFVGNVNNYGSCFPTDYNVTAAPYQSNLDPVTVCMTVSGTTLAPTADLTACLASGLISYDDTGAIVSPFANAGLKYLTANSNSGVTGALTVRAWMGSFFMSNTDLSGLPPFGSVTLAPTQTISVKGYSASSFAMNNVTSAADQNTSVTALCNQTGSALQSTMNETFEITVPEIVTAQTAINSKSTASSVVSAMNAAFKNTGTAAAQINIPLLGVKGTSFYGAFAGTATLTLDGATLGTATLTLPTTSGLVSQTAQITLPSTTVVTANSTFDVSVTGTLTLTCDNANATSRTVAAKPGVPTLLWFQQH